MTASRQAKKDKMLMTTGSNFGPEQNSGSNLGLTAAFSVIFDPEVVRISSCRARREH